MRIKKELVILIIVIILLSIYLTLRSRDRTHYSLPELSELSREEITKIEIARSEGSIFLQKEEDTWNIIPQKWPVEDYIVGNMLEAMEELKVTTLVSESKNYERYGLSDKEKLFYWLAIKTDGYSGADIETLCREAAMIAVRDNAKANKVTKNHFSRAMESVRASITSNMIKFYEKVSETLGSGIAKKDKSEKDIQYM